MSFEYDLPVFLNGVMCYEGEETPPETPAEETPAEETTKTFDQKAVNGLVAAERKKTEDRYKTQLVKAERTYQDLLTNNRLTEEERERLQSSLADVQKEMRTKEEQAAHEKKQLEKNYTEKLTEAEKEAKKWQDRYRTNEIKRALQDAAVSAEAYNPQHIVTLLKDSARLSDISDEATGALTGEHRVVIEYTTTNETGESVTKIATPSEYLKTIKEQPENMNLFKSAMQGGLGGTTFGGGGAKGEVDLSKLTGAARTEMYRKIKAEQPERLGLRPNKPTSR